MAAIRTYHSPHEVLSEYPLHRASASLTREARAARFAGAMPFAPTHTHAGR